MVGLIAGTVLSVVDSDPIRLLILSAIVNGIAAGPFLIVVMLISGDRAVMGKYVNGKLAATLGSARVRPRGTGSGAVRSRSR